MPSQHLVSLTRKSLESGKALITIIIILIALPVFLISSFARRASVAQCGTGEEDRMVGCLSSLPHGVQHPHAGRAGTVVVCARLQALGIGGFTSPEKKAKLKPRAGLSYPQHHAVFCISPSLQHYVYLGLGLHNARERQQSLFNTYEQAEGKAHGDRFRETLCCRSRAAPYLAVCHPKRCPKQAEDPTAVRSLTLSDHHLILYLTWLSCLPSLHCPVLPLPFFPVTGSSSIAGWESNPLRPQPTALSTLLMFGTVPLGGGHCPSTDSPSGT